MAHLTDLLSEFIVNFMLPALPAVFSYHINRYDRRHLPKLNIFRWHARNEWNQCVHARRMIGAMSIYRHHPIEMAF